MTKTYSLKAVDMGINTHQEAVIYMREDCHVCRAEGFTASTRIKVMAGKEEVIATLNIVDNHILEPGCAGLSKDTMRRLYVATGDSLIIGHAPVLSSLQSVRKKVFGHDLNGEEINAIIRDISAHHYSDIEISSFITACAGKRLTVDEIIALTQAMVDCGKRLQWPEIERVYDKHCVGGLPGNRTTPLVVAIASAAGLVMPKTSSRAITSPAGTADTMDALTYVHLSLEEMHDVVKKVGACLVWGGAVNLSPADDILIRIERALDVDGEGQLIASVLSKKIAAGSTHAIVDIPVGETAKVRSRAEADRLSSLFVEVGDACGIHIRCVITDGSVPVGFGIGPVEEARDILAVLKGEDNAPEDLKERSLLLAGHLIDLARDIGVDEGIKQARAILEDGRAWQQFQNILDAQGGMKQLPVATYSHTELAQRKARLIKIDNRQLSRLAKLAGAPNDLSAGVRLHIKVGNVVNIGDPLFTLYCDSQGEQDYALDYFHNHSDILTWK